MPFIPMPDSVRLPPMRTDVDADFWHTWTRQPDSDVLHVGLVGPAAPVELPEALRPAQSDQLPTPYIPVSSGAETTLSLRDYQREAIEAINHSWHSGHKAPLLVLPTGVGKTIVAATMMGNLFGLRGKRSLFLAHRRELLGQTAEKMRLVSDCRVGIIQGKRNEMGRDITIGSIQTLGHHNGRRLEEALAQGPYDFVVCDEAHHAVSAQWQRVLRALREHYPEMRLLGMTATPGRSDGTALDRVFDDVAYQRSLVDMIQGGWLVPTRGFRVTLDVDLDRVATRNGDFVSSQLSKVMNTPFVNEAVVRAWQEYGHDRKTLVFAVDVAHAHALRDCFVDAGYTAAAIDGKTKKSERDSTLRQFREGEIKLLVNCEILVEGYDDPSTEAVLLARPTQSQALYIQCLDAATQVLTQNGWRGADDIQDDDTIGTLDTATGVFAWSPILSRVDRPLHPDEHMYALKLPAVDIRVTGKHRMVYKQRERFCWNPADAMPRAFKLIVAAPSEIPDNKSISDETLSFLGWWYSEGSLNKSTNALQLYQSASSPFLADMADAIAATGFKFGRSEKIYDTKFKKDHHMVTFCVSYGTPRGRDKHKTGWSPIAHWIPTDGTKRPVPAFWSLSTRQLLVFLAAFNKGDGARLRSPSINYTPRTWRIYQKTGIQFHDEIQALCVSRGIRCNIYESVVDGKPHKVLGITPGKTMHAIGAGSRTRPELGLHRTVRLANERVWCVETVTGTLITRRNGRVAIVGNCLGRGLRLWPGKTECLVVDCVGNSARHEPVQLASLAGFDPENAPNGRGGNGEEDEEDEEPEVVGAEIHGEEVSLTGRASTARYQWRETSLGFMLNIPRVGYYLIAWSDRKRTQCTIRFFDQRPGRRDDPPRDVLKEPIGFEMAYGLVESEMDRFFNARGRRKGRTHQHEDSFVPDVSFVDLDDGLTEDMFLEQTMLRDAQWRANPMSAKQGALLVKLGVKQGSLPETMGEASDLISILQVQKDAKMRVPATVKQLAYLRVNGFPIPPDMTKGAAAKIIWRHRKGFIQPP